MGRKGIAVRILGIASTSRGFAFAVTEGPRRLVASGLRMAPPAGPEMVRKLAALVRNSRPLFVACEKPGRVKRERGRAFLAAALELCEELGVLVLETTRSHVGCLVETTDTPSKREIAEAVIEIFPELKTTLPAKREAWMGEDDRIEIFLAVAAAIRAWHNLGGPAAGKLRRLDD
jgi:hypothetical protein